MLLIDMIQATTHVLRRSLGHRLRRLTDTVSGVLLQGLAQEELKAEQIHNSVHLANNGHTLNCATVPREKFAFLYQNV